MVGFVQINNSYPGGSYLPLSVGVLQAYLEANLDDLDTYRFLLPIYRKVPVREATLALADADVILFSTYLWNFRISLEIARAAKEQSPGVIIAFGGPQVPDDSAAFLAENPFVDVACHGEGELIALGILEHGLKDEWDQVPGITHLSDDGALLRTKRPDRMRDLSQSPSPYLTGVFDPLIAANPETNWMVLWETNRGCPFSCAFCDWGSATQAKVNQFDMERLYKEVDWFAEREIEFVYSCDANFGLLPRDVEIAKYVASVKQQRSFPQRMSVFNTKNATERAYEVQKILSDAGLHRGVDIALQSLNVQTLESIKRANISLETFEELHTRFTDDGILTYSEMIIGLPDETYDTFAEGISVAIEHGQHNRIRFAPLAILPNAEMGNPAYQRKFDMRMVDARMTNSHGSIDELDESIYETQRLVISTQSMPADDWVRSRSFSILSALLHFDKLLQIPFILLHEQTGVSYRNLIETFGGAATDAYPLLAETKGFIEQHAREMQSAGPEFVPTPEWLSIQWPVDEYMMLKVCRGGRLDQFYDEAEQLLSSHLKSYVDQLPPGLLHEAIELNHALMKQPFQQEDLVIPASYNLYPFVRSVVTGKRTDLVPASGAVTVERSEGGWDSWDDWSREVIWYGNSTGAYLYDARYEATVGD